MPSSKNDISRQALIIVREGALTRKLIIPKEWKYVVASDDDAVWLALQQDTGLPGRRLLIISEGDFSQTVDFLRKRSGTGVVARLGVVVMSNDPVMFLRSSYDVTELLDAVPEKEFRKQTDLFLLRTSRLLAKSDDRGQRVNQKTLQKLNETFIALSAEREPERLLATILVKAMELASAESGTLYMIQETDGELSFRLRIVAEGIAEVKVKPLHLRVSESSVCGYVALTGKTLNIPDVNELRPLTLPQLQRGMDHFKENHTKSMLTIPFKNSRNEIVAILQLTNKKSNILNMQGSLQITEFDEEDSSLLASFATQSAICLENVDLYADIQRLFEGFVRASITAIESRDPSTGGHSERVAKISVALARATTECEVGIYRSVRFKEEEIRELEYAALLHDFGKIGVREEVLVKAKKLYAWQLDGIKERIKVCKAAAKITYLEKRLRGSVSEVAEKEYMLKLQEIDIYWQIILAANEPAVLKKENMEALDRIRNEQLQLPDGQNIALLSEDEYKALSVRRGSLTENERLEIESHVRHTYQFLKMIPWTKDFKHLPEIAYGHHEKLDGTGYPRGLTSHEIPLQSKIMTIADIFDALTAADRWYKEAVPTERAIDILASEVAEGKLDPVLYELFVEKKIYDVTQPKNVNRVA